MTDEQLWNCVRIACNLHPNAPIDPIKLSTYRYVTECAIHCNLTNSEEIKIDEWNELSDKQKVILIRHSPKWTTLELIEEVECILRNNNA